MTSLILLPGMMCDARLFSDQIASLSRHWPVMVMPLRGANSMAALALDVLTHAPPRFALAGISMGGIVAMEVLRQASDRVDRLALVDTNPRDETTAVKMRREEQMKAVRAGRLWDVMRDDMKPNYIADGPRRSEILDLCMDMAMTLGSDVFLDQSVALRDRPDQQETLRAYSGSSLIICGQNDKLCPVERHETMHALLPNSRLEIIPNAGHLTPLEQPQVITMLLERWLEE